MPMIESVGEKRVWFAAGEQLRILDEDGGICTGSRDGIGVASSRPFWRGVRSEILHAHLFFLV